MGHAIQTSEILKTRTKGVGGLGDFRHANPTLDPNTNPILRPPPLSLHWIIVEYGWMAGAAWLPSDISIEI